jgi:hypothetical protein
LLASCVECNIGLNTIPIQAIPILSNVIVAAQSGRLTSLHERGE